MDACTLIALVFNTVTFFINWLDKLMQILGICRFSYPAMGGFQIEHDSIEARCRYLYAPERLNMRFSCFETLTLPSIRAQSDPNFTFAILIGDSLPRHAKDRLYAMTAHVPQIKIVERPSGPYRQVAQEVINSVRNWEAPICAQFRLDDDDAVHLDFIAELREAITHHKELFRYGRRFAIDFCSGYAVTPGRTGLKAAAVKQKLWTPALAIVLRPKVERSILNYGHHRLHEFMPVLSFSHQNMFVRSFHGNNDSLATRSQQSFEYASLDKVSRRYFQQNFNIDETAVKAAWSAL